jgi:hypothetical protein
LASATSREGTLTHTDIRQRNAHSTFEPNDSAVQRATVSLDGDQVHFSLNFETNLTEQLRSIFTPSQLCNCFGPQTAHHLLSCHPSIRAGGAHFMSCLIDKEDRRLQIDRIDLQPRMQPSGRNCGLA